MAVQYDKYDEVSEDYFKRFKVQAPHAMPDEMNAAIKLMEKAISDGKPMEPLPDGAVT